MISERPVNRRRAFRHPERSVLEKKMSALEPIGLGKSELRKQNSRAMNVSVRGLSKRFSSVEVLDSIDLDLEGGEILGLVGANGTGKTTFLKIVAGILKADEGQVYIGDREIGEDPERARKRVGYLPDEPYLLEHLTASEVLWLAGSETMSGQPKLKETIRRLLLLWDLELRANDLLKTFSHGMRQKVLISAALLSRSPVLLLDEPFNGLDVYSAGILRRLILLLAGAGTTIVVSSHALSFVEEIASRVVVLSERSFVYDSAKHARHTGTLERLVMDSAPQLDPVGRADEIFALLRSDHREN